MVVPRGPRGSGVISARRSRRRRASRPLPPYRAVARHWPSMTVSSLFDFTFTFDFVFMACVPWLWLERGSAVLGACRKAEDSFFHKRRDAASPLEGAVAEVPHFNRTPSTRRGEGFFDFVRSKDEKRGAATRTAPQISLGIEKNLKFFQVVPIAYLRGRPSAGHFDCVFWASCHIDSFLFLPFFRISQNV